MLALLVALSLGWPLAFPGLGKNVVLIVIDDVGIDQLRCYRDQSRYTAPYAYAYTPNIDRLAENGARFTQCRASPYCSPTRAMLLTGRYGFRTGAGHLVEAGNVSSSFVELANPEPEILLPALLSGRTCAIGKWHLGLKHGEGGTMPEQPETLGFQAWRGTLRNLAGDLPVPPGWPPGYGNFWWWEGGVRRQVADVHATMYTEQQASLWLRQGEGPFFLYLAFNACHQPLTAFDIPPASQHHFKKAIPPAHENTIYRANLECLDRQVGALLDALPPETIVFLMGDNGTSETVMHPAPGEMRYPAVHPLFRPGDDTTPLSVAPYDVGRLKGTVYEGGIRVPLIVKGPGVVPGTRAGLAHAVDVFATIAALRDASIPHEAGRDSRPVVEALAGGSASRRFSFSEVFAPNGADSSPRTREDRAYVRQDGEHLWKVIVRLGLPDEFYDVAADPLELTNLGTDHVEYRPTLRALRALLGS